jgi:hypothetical protein
MEKRPRFSMDGRWTDKCRFVPRAANGLALGQSSSARKSGARRGRLALPLQQPQQRMHR